VHSPTTRQEHADADGQSVGLNETFSVSGEDLMYPADPSGSPGNTYNCLCFLEYGVDGGNADASDVDLSALDEGG
jgi:hypothetical protein